MKSCVCLSRSLFSAPPVLTFTCPSLARNSHKSSCFFLLVFVSFLQCHSLSEIHSLSKRDDLSSSIYWKHAARNMNLFLIVLLHLSVILLMLTGSAGSVYRGYIHNVWQSKQITTFFLESLPRLRVRKIQLQTTTHHILHCVVIFQLTKTKPKLMYCLDVLCE